MQWLMKCCTRSALGLIAAALLLAGVPAHVKAAPRASDAAPRERQPRLLAQSTTQPGEAEQLEKRRLEEQRQQAEKAKQQQTEPKKMKTRGAMPEAAPAPEAMPSKTGGKRFGAGVVRNKESGEE